MIYKNISCIEKTFHGVRFKPGEIREVDGYINDVQMIRITEAEFGAHKRLTAGRDSNPQYKKSELVKHKGEHVNGEDNNQ